MASGDVFFMRIASYLVKIIFSSKLNLITLLFSEMRFLRIVMCEIYKYLIILN